MGACGIAVPPLGGAVGDGICPGWALPRSWDKAASLMNIKTGITIVMARM
jgi:hypothetical protein